MASKRLNTKWRYFIYIALLHLALGAAMYFLLIDQLYFFLLVELVLLISLYIAYKFFRTFMAPVELVDQGEGAMMDQDFTLKFLPVGSQEVDRLVHLYNDMIDNLRAERTGTQEQHFFLEKLIATAELGVIVMDYNGQIATINDWALQSFNLSISQSPPADLREIAHPLAHALVDLPMNQSVVIQLSGNQRFRAEKGDFIDRGFSRNFILVQDITRDLLAAEKEAYGKIIRMMAHEVNNSTGATNSLLKSLLDTDDLSSDELQELVKEYLPVVVERGQKMNTFMRNFASVIRLPAPKRERVDLRELIVNCGKLMEAKCLENDITVAVETGNIPVIVKADASQLEQVIINAITNAQESIVQHGQIVLSTTASPLGFVIADDGPGIQSYDADLIFTPFFSTKPAGQGVGLTLSRDILESHQASYHLKTEADGWTRFRVMF